MLRLVAARLVTSALALVGASILAFVILRITPGDPARLILGTFAPQASVDRLREELGLNLPLAYQYLIYVRTFLSGDWGFSYSTGEPVAAQLSRRFPATLELGLY